MIGLGQFRRFSQRALPLLLVSGALAGCSRPAVFHGTGTANQSSDPKVPFHPDGGTDPAGTYGSEPASAGQNQHKSQNVEGQLPFDTPSSRNLPAGTLLTVRLENALSGGKAGAGNSFAAVVDAPVIIDGSAILPRGASVHGRIESARASELRRDTGYVRLTLDSITIDGRDIPLQTSSLFARGVASEDPDLPARLTRGAPEAAHSRIILLTKGRRLTFRVTGAVVLQGPQAIPSA